MFNVLLFDADADAFPLEGGYLEGTCLLCKKWPNSHFPLFSVNISHKHSAFYLP